MRKIISIVILILFANTLSFANHPATFRISRDSMRTKWIDGKKFLVHKVAKGETFYSIARDYKIDVKDLMNANKGVTSLKTGQIIQVPVAENFVAPAKQTEETVKETDEPTEQTEEPKPVAQEKAVAKSTSQSGNLFHTVKKGETLSAIARKYNVPASEIAALNNLKKNQINIGQKLIIKKDNREIVEKEVATTKNTEPTAAVAKADRMTKSKTESNSSNVYHTVTKGETLYGISKKYGVSSKDVEDWNDIKNKSVKIGQKLIVKKEVAAASPTLETVRTKVADNTMDAPKTAEVEKKVNEVKEAETKTAETKSVDENISTTVIDKTPSGKNVKQAIENGEAAWVNDADLNPNKYFALHRSAPIGTIMKVTNRMNGKYVFVKVIGKLPGTGDNDKLIVKISKAAADRLGVLDQTFQCELNYAFAVE